MRKNSEGLSTLLLSVTVATVATLAGVAILQSSFAKASRLSKVKNMADQERALNNTALERAAALKSAVLDASNPSGASTALASAGCATNPTPQTLNGITQTCQLTGPSTAVFVLTQGKIKASVEISGLISVAGEAPCNLGCADKLCSGHFFTVWDGPPYYYYLSSSLEVAKTGTGATFCGTPNPTWEWLSTGTFTSPCQSGNQQMVYSEEGYPFDYSLWYSFRVYQCQ